MMPTAFITCHFNPQGYEKPLQNWQRFRQEWAFPVISAEAYWDQPATDSEILVQATNNQICWQKERLLNLIIEQLPAKYDKIAWIDADVSIPDLTEEMLTEALRYDRVTQLFETIDLLDINGEVEQTYVGSAAGKMGVERLGSHYKSGYAWAARREVLETGLYDAAIMGSGDVLMLNAWYGLWTSSPFGKLPVTTRRHWLSWAWPTYEKVQGRVGYLPLKATHWYHGSQSDRNYADRYRIIKQYDFNAYQDIEIDLNGLWAWTDEAPKGLPKEVENHFIKRREDS